MRTTLRSFVASAGLAAVWLTATPQMQVTKPRLDVRGPFYIRSHTGKCLTVGSNPQDPGSASSGAAAAPGAAVYMDACNGSSSMPAPTLPQRVITQELTRHEVVLRVQDQAIGVAAAVEGMPLQLQALDYSAGQRWAFDGDTLISVMDRTLVAAVKDGRTPAGTAVVLKRRDLADAEFWDFVAVDGSNTRPHGGFKHVAMKPTLEETQQALQDAVNAAAWGTVIEIDQDVAVPMDAYPLVVRDGVTIRGDRRGTLLGPELRFDYFTDGNGLIDVQGDHVRVTGVRVHGPSTEKDQNPLSSGIAVTDADLESAIIDHNEMWGWTHTAVKVMTVHDAYDETPCGDVVPNRPRNVRVVRNFIHHNIRGGSGYGVQMYPNAFSTIAGNTFVYNRHAIAATGFGLAGYRALYNLVTSGAPGYGVLGHKEHDFDMHGTEGGSHHTGGHAGLDVEITRNTFLGTNRRNYDLRGIPCALHRFTHNIARQSAGGAIRWYEYAGVPPSGVGLQLSPPSTPPSWLQISSNQFDSSDPTDRLGVGDFDGDGKDDLFLATGSAWYYAPAGQAEWRLRNTRLETIGDLLFGDVDGDSRTDVLIKQGANWLVSWAGASKPEQINQRDGDIRDFAVADFNGDRRADILHTDGQHWHVSYGGVAPFAIYETAQSTHAWNLRFGDFNADGKADVFVPLGGSWMARYGGTPGLATLRPALPVSTSSLVVADFDGDGRADVAGSLAVGGGWFWLVSYRGTEEWSELRTAAFRLRDAAAIGRFDGTPGTDVLDWNLIEPGATKYLDIAPSGGPVTQRHSRDHMR